MLHGLAAQHDTQQEKKQAYPPTSQVLPAMVSPVGRLHRLSRDRRRLERRYVLRWLFLQRLVMLFATPAA
jgi:hypothetical protein